MLEATGPMLMKRVWTKWNKYDDDHNDEVLLAGKTSGRDAVSDADRDAKRQNTVQVYS